jgi:hypothetical protein
MHLLCQPDVKIFRSVGKDILEPAHITWMQCTRGEAVQVMCMHADDLWSYDSTLESVLEIHRHFKWNKRCSSERARHS